MATATLFRSIHRRNISSPASFLACKSLSGAKTSGNGSYLSRKCGVIARSFSTEGTIIGQVIGIDLGTTNARVAVMDGEIARVITNAEGSLSTHSVVAFNDRGEYLTVGSVAKDQAVTKPENTVFGAKRLVGRWFDGFQIQKERRILPYNIVTALNGDAWIEVNGRKYCSKQIVAFVLAKMKETAEDYLGKKVDEAVISVPGCFNWVQRQAIKDAARIADLKVHSIINEPKAAAISYALHNKDGYVAVIDLGGGTFDVSISKIFDKLNPFECVIVAQNGDSSLGGVDFDAAIVDFLISEFKRTDGIDLRDDIVAFQRLREAAEKAKIELSTEKQTEIDLPFIITDAYGAKHLNITLTRSEFEAQVKHLIQRIRSLCKALFKKSVIKSNELDEVILVGGMSGVPIVQEAVIEIFEKKTPIKVVDPDEGVAMGAAYYGWFYNSIHEEEEEEEPYDSHCDICE